MTYDPTRPPRIVAPRCSYGLRLRKLPPPVVEPRDVLERRLRRGAWLANPELSLPLEDADIEEVDVDLSDLDETRSTEGHEPPRDPASARYVVYAGSRPGELYLRAGADAIYIESPESVAELKQCGRAFRALSMTSMLEGGKTPILKPSELYAMGFNIVIYGITLLLRITRTMQLALEDLKSERLELVGSGVSFDEYMRIVGLDRWSSIEQRFDVESTDG